MKRISVAAFEGETPESTSARADEVHWLRVGQLGKLLDVARRIWRASCHDGRSTGPGNLFQLRPDVRALILLAKLKRRNAATLFEEVANQLGQTSALSCSMR